MNIAYYAAADEDVFDCTQVRVLEVILYRDILELDIQVLVNRLECAGNLDIIFELDCDLLIDKGFEEAR